MIVIINENHDIIYPDDDYETVEEFSSVPDPAIRIRTYVGLIVPKIYGGQLPFQLCLTKTKCIKSDVSVFGNINQPGM